jgi:hypothetical protein
MIRRSPTTHSTRRLDSIPFKMLPRIVDCVLLARRGLIRALGVYPFACVSWNENPEGAVTGMMGLDLKHLNRGKHSTGRAGQLRGKGPLEKCLHRY